MGIRDKPIAPASPWQNGFAERLIGSIRRECVDHFIIFGEAHQRRILRTYACYYNDIRTHWSLDKDAPVSRPVQRIGSINSHAILGGLHHQLCARLGFRYTPGASIASLQIHTHVNVAQEKLRRPGLNDILYLIFKFAVTLRKSFAALTPWLGG